MKEKRMESGDLGERGGEEFGLQYLGTTAAVGPSETLDHIASHDSLLTGYHRQILYRIATALVSKLPECNEGWSGFRCR
jgi:hypothetical protein